MSSPENPTPSGVRSVNDPVLTELARARRLYPPMRSLEEGLWIIQEEWEELKAESYRKPAARDLARLREECIQLEAMLRRLREDVLGGEG